MRNATLRTIDEGTCYEICDAVAYAIFLYEREADTPPTDLDDFAPVAAELLTPFQRRIDVPEGMVGDLVHSVARELLDEARGGLAGEGWFDEEQSNALAGRVYDSVARSLGYVNTF